MTSSVLTSNIIIIYLVESRGHVVVIYGLLTSHAGWIKT